MKFQIRQLIIYNNQIIPFRGYGYSQEIRPLRVADIYIDEEGRLFLKGKHTEYLENQESFYERDQREGLTREHKQL